MKAKVDSALKITQNTLEKGKVWFPWGMHKQTNLLNGIRNIRSGESEILEGSCETTVQGAIGD
ncbi:hypothetical protein HanRHA438_Chr14g0650211 [Helianthus annuus]|nr:hypothetical protein HanRHA438_Chr14g0650211 [Helianthus annuus]